MAKIISALLFVITACIVVQGQMGMGGMGGGGKKDKVHQPIKADLGYITCSVCEKIVENLYELVEKKTADLPKYQKK